GTARTPARVDRYWRIRGGRRPDERTLGAQSGRSGALCGGDTLLDRCGVPLVCRNLAASGAVAEHQGVPRGGGTRRTGRRFLAARHRCRIDAVSGSWPAVHGRMFTGLGRGGLVPRPIRVAADLSVAARPPLG